jgi:acyl-coenzyme A synthetase/AMP-(fatty) acid ligase
VIAVLAKRFKSYRFCFVKAFPRTETGKVKRKELQQRVVAVVSKKSALQ